MAPHGRQFSIDRLNSTNLLMQFRSRLPLYSLQMGRLRWVGDRFLAGMKTPKRDAIAPLETPELCARIKSRG